MTVYLLIKYDIFPYAVICQAQDVGYGYKGQKGTGFYWSYNNPNIIRRLTPGEAIRLDKDLSELKREYDNTLNEIKLKARELIKG